MKPVCFFNLSEPQPFCLVLQINIQRDDELSYDIVGEGVNEEPRGLLSFDKTTGDLHINGAVDYEEKKKIKVIGGWGLCCGVKVKDVLSSPVCLLCHKNDLRTVLCGLL